MMTNWCTSINKNRADDRKHLRIFDKNCSELSEIEFFLVKAQKTTIVSTPAHEA